MIPDNIDIKASWEVLPPGIHSATINEIRDRFVHNERRGELFNGLINALKELTKSGCKEVYLDGSFITSKPIPGDYDACWKTNGVNVNKLDPVFLDFSQGRKSQKEKYGGEFFPTHFIADGVNEFLDYFQVEKETGGKKGILKINLVNFNKEVEHDI